MIRKINFKICIPIIIMMLLFPVISLAETNGDFEVPEYTEAYNNWRQLSEEEKQNSIEPMMYDMLEESLEEDSQIIDSQMVGAVLPSNYKRSYYGQVRNQNTNLCWACSSANMFETNYFLINKVKRYFSDFHMEYMTSNTYNSNGFNRRYDGGGNVSIALAYATNGMGIVSDGNITSSNFKSKKPVAKVSDYDMIYASDIKNYVYNYGVVSAYTYMNAGFFSSQDVNNNRNLAYYCPMSSLVPNHAVTIVGWDDNYTNSAFPTLKGAFIVLNSYGSTFGNNGLYYIFYDDVFMKNSQYCFVTKTDDIDYTNIYQYDEYGPTAVIGWISGTYSANVFSRKTTSNEDLTELGLYFPENENLTVYINANGDNKNINNATYSFTTGTHTAGYHTIKLPKEVTLSGSKFTVIVKHSGKMGAEYRSTDSSSWWYTATCNLGESFVSQNGINWNDMKVVSELEGYGANACIKAFTNPSKNNNKPAEIDYSNEVANYAFDYQYYAEHNLDLYQAYGYNERDLRNHWNYFGKAEGRASSPIFDAKYYLENNSDLKRAYGNNYISAYNHFITFGYKEYRKSSIEYDGSYYKSKNSDLSNMTAIELIRHYCSYGKNELRQANTTYDIVNVLFDSSFYSKMYSDLNKAFGNSETRLKDHWLRFGISEGRTASLAFDAKYYLNKYSDLRKAFGNDYVSAYKHFITYGFTEKRQASPVFCASYFLDNNSDLKAKFESNYLKALNYFNKTGKYENRPTSSNFNVGKYRSYNSDLYRVYRNNYEMYYMHYLIFGVKENRVCK